MSSMSIEHQHHHHYYSQPHADASSVAQHSHHLHHYHFQPQSSVASSLSESSMSSHDPRCCSSCRCSKRVLTGIVITILPIAITSTLICVFMMQKTNLHQYAIYSFVIFCVAFVFPFALFFFTVILNKIYKFYKREIRSNPPNNLNSLFADTCDPEVGVMHSNTLGYNHSVSNAATHSGGPIPGRALLVNSQQGTGQNASLICYSSRAYHPYYYHMEDGTIVAYAPDNSLIMEDSPPSYEMALLCPSVTHHHFPPTAFISATPIQVILPKEQCKEKRVETEGSRRSDSPSRQSSVTFPSQVPDISPNEVEGHNSPEQPSSENCAQSSAESNATKSIEGQNVVIPTG